MRRECSPVLELGEASLLLLRCCSYKAVFPGRTTVLLVAVLIKITNLVFMVLRFAVRSSGWLDQQT